MSGSGGGSSQGAGSGGVGRPSCGVSALAVTRAQLQKPAQPWAALACRTRHFHCGSWLSAPFTPGGFLTPRSHEGFWMKLEKEGFHRLIT